MLVISSKEVLSLFGRLFFAKFVEQEKPEKKYFLCSLLIPLALTGSPGLPMSKSILKIIRLSGKSKKPKYSLENGFYLGFESLISVYWYFC